MKTGVVFFNKHNVFLPQSSSGSNLLSVENSLYKRHELNSPSLKDFLNSPSSPIRLSSQPVFSFEEHTAAAQIPEISHKQLEYVKDIGEGEFGQVKGITTLV